jgi:hypothetical protein
MLRDIQPTASFTSLSSLYLGVSLCPPVTLTSKAQTVPRPSTKPWVPSVTIQDWDLIQSRLGIWDQLIVEWTCVYDNFIVSHLHVSMSSSSLLILKAICFIIETSMPNKVAMVWLYSVRINCLQCIQWCQWYVCLWIIDYLRKVISQYTPFKSSLYSDTLYSLLVITIISFII